MSKRGLTDRTISGVLWTAWGKGGHTILNLVSLMVLARLIAPQEFGTVGAAVVVTEFSSIFARLGLGPAVVQRKDLEPRHIQAAFTGSLLLGVLIGGAIWLGAGYVAWYFGNDLVEPVIKALAWVFPLKGISAVAESLMLRDLRFRWLANLELATFTIGQLAVAIPLALMGYGAWALVAAVLGQTLVRSGVLLWARRPPIGLRVEWQACKDMLHFGGGFTLARLANQLALSGDNMVVGHHLGPAALGLYGRAYSLMSAPSSALGKVLDDVLFPTMAKIQDDPVRLGLAYRRGVAMIALVTLPASFVMFILAPELVRVALGSKWISATPAFQILAVGTLFRTSYKMSDALARSTGMVYRRARRQIVYAILVLTGAYVGQRWGLSGVALGVLGALLVNFLLMAQLSLDVCQLSWGAFWEAHRPGLVLGAMSGGAVWALATILREMGTRPLAVVLAAAGVSGAVILCLARRFPSACLGADGIWTVGALSSFLNRTRSRSRVMASPAL
jgi:O-antigen/teichoic acid export membrane protein